MYVFPLPADCAVDELRMQVGERTIVGEIRERAAAHAAYEAGRREGRRASLVEQERPNMFVSSVANIPRGGTITITIAYLDSIAYRDGRYTLSLPLTITPRYTPGEGADSARRCTAAAAVNSPSGRAAARRGRHPGRSRARLCAGRGAEPLPRHPPRLERDAASASRSQPSEAPADRDFELTWKPQVAPDTQAVAFSERDGNDAFGSTLAITDSGVARQ